MSTSPRKTARRIGHAVGVVAVLGVVVALAVAGRKYIDRDVAPGGPLSIAFKDRPAWMSDSLIREIATTLPTRGTSVFDDGLLKRAAANLAKSPWVKSVRQVRRVYVDGPGDRLEIDCEFRSPIAAVEWLSHYWLIDNDGVKLSEAYTAAELPRVLNRADGTPNLRVIKGIHDAMPETGKVWPGRDVAAALDLVKLFDGQAYLNDVRAIDVSNFEGRRKKGDPQIVLETKFDTQIWWGRPINGKDYFVEVPVEKKLAELQSAVARFGRIDANRAWLDVRFDHPQVPAMDSSTNTGDAIPR